MPDRATPDIRLANLVHFDRRHHPAKHVPLLKSILDRQRIDHCRQHPHIVGGDAVHLFGLLRHAPEKVPPTHHNGHFHTHLVNFGQLGCDLVNANRIDAEAHFPGPGQRLAGQLQNDAFVHATESIARRGDHSED